MIHLDLLWMSAPLASLGLVVAPVAAIPGLALYGLYLVTGRFAVRVSESGIRITRTVLGIPFWTKRFTYQCTMEPVEDGFSELEGLLFSEGKVETMVTTWGTATDTSNDGLMQLIFEAARCALCPANESQFQAWQHAHFEQSEPPAENQQSV